MKVFLEHIGVEIWTKPTFCRMFWIVSVIMTVTGSKKVNQCLSNISSFYDSHRHAAVFIFKINKKKGFRYVCSCASPRRRVLKDEATPRPGRYCCSDGCWRLDSISVLKWGSEWQPSFFGAQFEEKKWKESSDKTWQSSHCKQCCLQEMTCIFSVYRLEHLRPSENKKMDNPLQWQAWPQYVIYINFKIIM